MFSIDCLIQHVSIPNSAHQFFAGGRLARPHFCNSCSRFSAVSPSLASSQEDQLCHISKSTIPLERKSASALQQLKFCLVRRAMKAWYGSDRQGLKDHPTCVRKMGGMGLKNVPCFSFPVPHDVSEAFVERIDVYFSYGPVTATDGIRQLLMFVFDETLRFDKNNEKK